MEKPIEPIKILVIGNSGVGKTSLCRLFFSDKFTPAHKPTVGVEFSSKQYISKGNEKYTLTFWDIGGQERYIYMTNVYYRNADFCLVMFDLTDHESFESCYKWKVDLDLKYKLPDGSKCPCLLIGNKSDMPKALDQTEIEEFCQKYGFYGYMEVSVKKDLMVRETIDYILTKITSLREHKAKLKEELKKESNKLFKSEINNTNSSKIISKSIEFTERFKGCCVLL